MTGLYFYKLISPFKDDMTKDCKLTINELDSNFLTLKEADIKDVKFDNETSILSLTRKSGEVLDADLSILSDGVTKNLVVDYDSVKGEITIHYNGASTTIDKLVTLDNIDGEILKEVISDGTLIGLGSKKTPLGISPVHKTGSYKPAIKMYDIIEGEHLPLNNKKGDRYVSREALDEYGRLYNYKGVSEIAKDLKNGWRIPTKSDWDNMLNAIEPCEYKNHGNANSNRVYGKLAGKLLKSKTLWTVADNEEEICSTCNVNGDVNSVSNDNYLDDGSNEVKPQPKKIKPNGVDSYGMRLVPAGYHDDCSVEAYFHDRGYYWTSTAISETDIYIKRFDYNRSGVVQLLASPKEYYSLRLVKDYTGDNYQEVEFINGQNYPCVLVPTENTKHGFTIWTVANADFHNPRYGGIEPNDGLIDEKTVIPTFYINEWDGFNWVRKQIQEGEQIVLFSGLDGDKNIEYMVVDGNLVSSAKIIENKVRGDIQKEIDALDKRVDYLEKDLGNATEYEYEYQRDDNGDIIFDNNGNPLKKLDENGKPIIKKDKDGNPIISKEATGLHKDVESNTEAITSEIERSIEADEQLANWIGQVSDDVVEETERAQKAEEELSNRIDEMSHEVAKIENINKSVGLNEDGTLPEHEGNYIGDAENIQGEIKALDTALKAEETNRLAEDEKINGRLLKNPQTDKVGEESRPNFDCANGVLTLEAEDPKNNITINLNGDFGTIPYIEY